MAYIMAKENQLLVHVHCFRESLLFGEEKWEMKAAFNRVAISLTETLESSH